MDTQTTASQIDGSPVVVISSGALQPVERHHLQALQTALPGRRIIVDPDTEELALLIEKVEIVSGSLGGPNAAGADLWQRATGLKWLQTHGAGVEWVVPIARAHGFAVTNASGVHAEPISEHLLAMLLALARQLPWAFRTQQARVWRRQHEYQVFELGGARALVLGTGAIGHAFARKAAALGMEVVGVRRSASDTEGAATAPAEPPYLRMVGPTGWRDELPATDFLVNTLPLTAETRGFVDRAALAAIKRGAYVFNIGRGATIDHAALTDALRTGQLGGAGLDVTDPEPLPEDSSLWDMPNVIITTHYSGVTPRYAQRLWEIFLDNARRYQQGQPLRNLVDVDRGY